SRDRADNRHAPALPAARRQCPRQCRRHLRTAATPTRTCLYAEASTDGSTEPPGLILLRRVGVLPPTSLSLPGEPHSPTGMECKEYPYNQPWNNLSPRHIARRAAFDRAFSSAVAAGQHSTPHAEE